MSESLLRKFDRITKETLAYGSELDKLKTENEELTSKLAYRSNVDQVYANNEFNILIKSKSIIDEVNIEFNANKLSGINDETTIDKIFEDIRRKIDDDLKLDNYPKTSIEKIISTLSIFSTESDNNATGLFISGLLDINNECYALKIHSPINFLGYKCRKITSVSGNIGSYVFFRSSNSTFNIAGNVGSYAFNNSRNVEVNINGNVASSFANFTQNSDMIISGDVDKGLAKHMVNSNIVLEKGYTHYLDFNSGTIQINEKTPSVDGNKIKVRTLDGITYITKD